MAKEFAMCYLIRDKQAGAEHGSASSPEMSGKLRPRWIGAGAAALAGGLALAALVTPAPLTPPRQSAAAVPMTATMGAAPATPVVEQRTSAVDDGVPTTRHDVAKAGGDCHHGL